MNSIGLVIFTSNKLETLADFPWDQLVIAVFMVENLLLIFRYVLAALIPDIPGDIVDEQRSMENRVKQIRNEINNKVLMTKMDRSLKGIDFVEEVI